MLLQILLSCLLFAKPHETNINMLQVKEVISKHYYKELPDSIKHLPWSEYKKHLDRYTRILDFKEASDFDKEMSRRLEGVVGISVDSSDSGFYIDEVFKDGSAYNEGIVRGDIIKKINGKNLKTHSDISYLISGRIGTRVNLEILRGNKLLEFNLQRIVLEESSVFSQKKDKTAIIQISGFTEKSDFEFYLHSVALNPKTIDTLIIDLQHNGGGLLYKCLRISEEFFTKDELMVMRISRSDTAFDFSQKEKGIWSDAKFIIVLQNHYTASASELLSAILKYGRNAIIKGDTSYGKGLVQSQFEVQGGRLFVTSQEYYPLGKIKVNGIGVVPDKNIEFPLYYDFTPDFDIKKFREDYPNPSINALKDIRIKNKSHISHILWEKDGELFEMLLQKAYN